jgi:hypothetical protein
LRRGTSANTVTGSIDGVVAFHRRDWFHGSLDGTTKDRSFAFEPFNTCVYFGLRSNGLHLVY